MANQTLPSARHDLKVALLLLAVPVLIFWRPIFFYILDDWTALIQMAELPFGQYLVRPDGEQWFPFFHLIFYGLVKTAGEKYYLLVLVNCLGTGANAFLLYLFFRRHWSWGLALTLSLLYAGAAVHHAIAWNGFYVGYLLSLGFFLGALLLTDSYLKTSGGAKLWGIGLCAGLSVLSHNYPLTGLAALPLYALIMGEGEGRGKFWPLAFVVGAVYLIFAVGYYKYAGVSAATSHNLRVFSGLPGLAYLTHLLYGAFLSPFFYLFWGHYHFPVAAYVAGVSLMALSLAVVWGWGGSPEKRLVLWALLANVLPFILVSLTRYQRSVNQAFVARYGIFTLIGALILVGTAWRLAHHRMPQKRWFHLLTLALLGAMAYGQIFTLPRWHDKYLEMSRAARTCYQKLNHEPELAGAIPAEEYRKFCPTAHPALTRSQAAAIRRFLKDPPERS
ncbi:MAG TPA: hypothetical protein VGA79_01995 [Desulfobaccales bacterium]